MHLVLLSSIALSLLFPAHEQPSFTSAPEIPTPETILERAIQSIGGKRAIDSMESFDMHGVMRLPNNKPVIEIELASAKGGKVLGMMSFIGLGQTRFGSDGIISWEQTFEADGSIHWSLIGQQTLSQKVKQINWLEWFTTLPQYLDSMKVLKQAEFDGELCWEIEYTTHANATRSAFFSCDTFKPRGRRSHEQTSSGLSQVDVAFRNWGSVDKLLLFKEVAFIRNNQEVTLTIDFIEIDEVPPALFKLPHEVRALTPDP
ncbi:MAG: hypothetical protein VX615_02605 [Planctomycetota bacterium]|nr:hypothetical protein [Planctomycetota bacterium]